MHRPAELEVADHRDLEAINRSPLFRDRVEVEEGLSRVLAGAVAGVDEGNARSTRRLFSTPLLWVAHGDHVGVQAHHPHRVLDRFAFVQRAELEPVGGDHHPPESLHRRLEGESRARRGFVEQRGENFPLEQIAPALLQYLLHLPGDAQNEIGVRSAELPRRD